MALLAYLALAAPEDFQHRATLVAMFWPELEETHARGALRQAFHFLRRHIGRDLLLSRGEEEVRLNPDACWCDATAFEAAVASERVEEAFALYRGDLLEGFSVSGAPDFERWLERRRSRLARAYQAVLQSCATGRGQRWDLTTTAEWWGRLVARTPEDGRLVLGLMEALEAAGDRVGALRQAERYRALLQEEFDATPDPAITAMAERLRRGR
jgi:serine/threonine-protein kinase